MFNNLLTFKKRKIEDISYDRMIAYLEKLFRNKDHYHLLKTIKLSVEERESDPNVLRTCSGEYLRYFMNDKYRGIYDLINYLDYAFKPDKLDSPTVLRKDFSCKLTSIILKNKEKYIFKLNGVFYSRQEPEGQFIIRREGKLDYLLGVINY